jgi:hypothetical protein
VQRTEQLDGSRGAEIDEEGNAAAAITGDGRAVATHEPPASASLVRRNRCEQALGFLVLERNESEITVAIEPDGDPRRPPAELSPAVVQQHGALQQGRKRSFDGGGGSRTGA